MTPPDDAQHRTYHQPDPGRVELRESDEDEEEGVFRVRMPIVTTGEVRNEGDDPFTPEEVQGMADQVADGGLGVFIDHGTNFQIADAVYSATEKVGEWEDPETQQRESDGETEVVATARLMEPESLPESMGAVREALSSLKEQVKREMTLSSSIGWRDDKDAPGGVDLMEASIVGIPADPRTTSQGAAVASARAILESADVDEATAEQLVADFRAVVMGPDSTPTQEASMADDNEDDNTQSGDPPDDDREGSDGIDEAEYRSEMLEMQRTQTETLNTLAEALRAEDDEEEEDDQPDGDEEDDGDDEEDDEEEEEEQSGDDEEDDEDDRSLEVDGEAVTASDVRELREQLAGAEPDVDDEGDEESSDGDDTTTQGRSTDGPDWRA